LQSYYTYKPPLLKKPPEIPLPDQADYGEIWVKYPIAQIALPTNYGIQFRATAELRMIMNDIACHFADHPTSGNRMSPEETVKFYSRLRSWYDALPAPLTASKIVLPSELILQ
jgi:hypothetical protein